MDSRISLIFSVILGPPGTAAQSGRGGGGGWRPSVNIFKATHDTITEFTRNNVLICNINLLSRCNMALLWRHIVTFIG